ncbi:type VI secretion system baseplate subunit TssF [Gynuella sp.]|uniref:type VI secretion system baseplate subunit TssF n=1 Tax=Gynuella sp. TaxID=2969146 RepID=UPI003D0DDBEF
MSTLSNDTLKQYFLREMEYLRKDSVRFAREYPQVAQELALNQERSDDPQVELLLQSFAYLSGQLRYQMAMDDAELPNQLLAALNPHLEIPWAPRSIIQLDVDPDGASFDKLNVLPAESVFTAPLSWNDEQLACRFRTTRAADIWPLVIRDVQVQSRGGHEQAEVVSCIKVSLKVRGQYSFRTMPITRLQFCLDGIDRFRVHDLLFSCLHGIELADPQSHEIVASLDGDCCEFIEDLNLNAILPGLSTVHPGLVNIREYFAFPEHFLFFNLNGLDLSGFDQELELRFLLTRPCLQIDADCLRLNAVPIINLFRQALEPFSIQAGRLEYQLTADQFRHPVTEILALEQLQLQGIDGRVIQVPPLYGSTTDIDDGYWLARRELSQTNTVPGTELFLRFVDTQLRPAGLQTARVTGRAWCCNRRLAEKLSSGSRLNLEGAGAVQTGSLLRKPSRHQTPDLSGDRSQLLVGQLSSHFQPFENGEVGVNMLRNLLKQHLGTAEAEMIAQIDAIERLDTRRITRRVGDDLWRGHCHGLQWQVSIDLDRFGSVSPLVFARVLNETLKHRVALNSFSELAIIDAGSGETLHCWSVSQGALWQQ